jgi:hypothetical protein
MIITDRVVFLQLQRTGCTHIERLLNDMFGGHDPFGKHRPLPRDFDFGSRLIVGSIRNPWDWYVSLWAYACNGQGGPYRRSIQRRSLRRVLADARARRLAGGRTLLDLVTISMCELDRPVRQWRHLQSNSHEPRHFREWLKLTLDSRRRYDLYQDYGHSPISAFTGLLTYLYELLYLRDSEILFRKAALPDLDALRQHDRAYNILAHTIRTECLEDDLIEALRHAGYGLTAHQEARIRSAEPTNASQRSREVAYYYDAESAELVGTKEQLIREKYGYTGPSLDGGPAPVGTQTRQ